MTPVSRLAIVRAEQPVSEAAELLRARGVKHLLVSDGQALVGVISAADLADRSSKAKVGEQMCRDVIAVDVTATLGEAVAAMRGLDIGCLPVVSERVVAGLLERENLARIGLWVD
jgi:CBS domain-containing protein